MTTPDLITWGVIHRAYLPLVEAMAREAVREAAVTTQVPGAVSMAALEMAIIRVRFARRDHVETKGLT